MLAENDLVRIEAVVKEKFFFTPQRFVTAVDGTGVKFITVASLSNVGQRSLGMLLKLADECNAILDFVPEDGFNGSPIISVQFY